MKNMQLDEIESSFAEYITQAFGGNRLLVKGNFYYIQNLNIVIFLAKVSDNVAELLKEHKENDTGDTKYIVIWADQWLHKTNIVKSRLQNILGANTRLMARKCLLKRIDKNTAQKFLTNYHLMGYVNAKLKYGLYYNSQLVSVACFSGPRNMPSKGNNYRSFELLRYANVLGYTIIGGLDKLLKAMETEQTPSDIMTYIDLAWSRGEAFQKLGFEVCDTKPPQKCWLHAQTLMRYTNFEARNVENLIEIFNLGSIKLIKSLQKSTQI